MFKRARAQHDAEPAAPAGTQPEFAGLTEQDIEEAGLHRLTRYGSDRFRIVVYRTTKEPAEAYVDRVRINVIVIFTFARDESHPLAALRAYLVESEHEDVSCDVLYQAASPVLPDLGDAIASLRGWDSALDAQADPSPVMLLHSIRFSERPDPGPACAAIAALQASALDFPVYFSPQRLVMTQSQSDALNWSECSTELRKLFARLRISPRSVVPWMPPC